MRFLGKSSFYALLSLILGLALAGGPARAQLTKQRSIVETVKTGTGATKLFPDAWGANNENPARMAAPPTGTGFKWGGYESSANIPTGSGAGGVSNLQFLEGGQTGADGSYGIFLMYNWAAGQYYYTIFSSAGANDADQYVDLTTPNAQIGWNNFTSNTGGITNEIKVRWLIRTNNNSQWYVSDPCTVSPVPTVSTPIRFPVSARTWYAVTGTVNTNLNALAGNDEVALSYATTASNPDLSKVDGGGFQIDTGVDPGPSTSFKPSRLTFDSNIPYLAATATPAYAANPSQLVVGLGNNAGVIKLGNGNAAGGTLTIKSVTVNSPDGRITANPAPTLPAILAATPLDVNIAFNQNGAQQTTASLTVVYTYPGAAADETVTIPILGRGVIDGTIYESFIGTNGARFVNYRPLYKQTPQQLTTPPAGSGFTWGGYTNATATEATPRAHINISNNRMAFNGALTNDAVNGSCYHSSYVYTIFDTLTFGATVDHTVNLHKFQFYSDVTPIGAQVRWLVRDDQARWFLSKNVTNISADLLNKFNYVDVDDLTQGWLRVDGPAEGYMNSLAASKVTSSTQVAIAEPNTLTAGTPNLAKVTGGGVYVETGNTTPDNTALTFCDLNFIARPSSGDTMRVTSTAVTESYKVPNRRLAMAGLTFDVTSGVDAALDGVDVSVSPNTTGLRSVMLYSDPNGNGKPEDGAELTNCTVDASTAHLLFRDNQIFIAGAPRRMALVAMFDETATSKTYTLSITPAQWKQDPENGGTGDTIVNSPSPISTPVTVGPVSLPATDTLAERISFSETWDNATAGIIPVTPATGAIAGADNAWSYTWAGSYNALFAQKNGSLALGAEVRTMTTESPLDSSFRVDSSLPYTENFDNSAVRVAKLDFDLVITSATRTTALAHLSGRVTGEQKNITLRLAAFNNTDAYTFTFYPLTDAERYVFGINYNANMRQYAPGNILAYSTGDGAGTYKFTLYLAPLGATATIAKVEMKHVETGKTLSWMTVIDGKIANLRNLRVAFGSYPDAYVDNLKLTTYAFFINPVKRWTLFE